LLKRAKICLKKSTECDDSSLSLEGLRDSEDTEQPALDPKSMIFFSRFIFDKGLVEESEIGKTALTMFEASMGYALIFRTKQDYDLCHNLLKQALINLDLMDKHLA